MIYLDTHAVVWLFAGEISRFTAQGKMLLEENELRVSPVVQLELQFLKEVDRITADSALILETLCETIRLITCPLPFSRIVVEAVTLDWTRDPFDRLIVAHARAQNAPLLTKDRLLHQHFPLACW